MTNVLDQLSAVVEEVKLVCLERDELYQHLKTARQDRDEANRAAQEKVEALTLERDAARKELAASTEHENYAAAEAAGLRAANHMLRTLLENASNNKKKLKAELQRAREERDVYLLRGIGGK